MTTEYRRNIPSVAHVEAATRLGLLWEESVEADRWRLEIRNGALFSDFAAADEGFTNWDRDLSRDRYSLDGYSLRPIRPDGTPVDWEVLDQEVARVGQQGPERRVAERIRGQTQAPTVTAAQPEPRRFADVRPDRHGWQWWRDLTTGDCFTIRDGVYVRRFDVIDPWLVLDLSAWLDRTVIPTDEQGNPVSWLSCGLLSHISVGSVGPMLPIQASFEGPTGEIEFSDTYTPPPGASGWVTLPNLHDSMRALPRFGLIELDDDDRTGQSRQAPGPALRSGTVPTAAQVAKFRGVLARKLDSTLADAVKESGVSSEVSQHVLQHWSGGLGDKEAAKLIGLILCSGTSTMPVAAVDELARGILANWSPKFADLGGEPARPAPSRGELEERRRRLAELQARLRAERAERPAEGLQEEPNRMALIEPDPAADPSASIRAWEERQEAAKAAAKLRPGLVTEREREPPRGPAVELVDASYLGSWLGRLYALANTDLPDTRLGARLGPRQRASG